MGSQGLGVGVVVATVVVVVVVVVGVVVVATAVVVGITWLVMLHTVTMGSGTQEEVQDDSKQTSRIVPYM